MAAGLVLGVVIMVLANFIPDHKKEDAAQQLQMMRQAKIEADQKFAAMSPAEQKVILAKRAEDAKAAEIAQRKVEQEQKDKEKVKYSRELALAGAQQLKKSMKDPDSFELKDASFMDNNSTCYTYRARNSFNAMLQSDAVLMVTDKLVQLYVKDSDGNKFANAWNKYCAGPHTHENLTDIISKRI